MASGGAVCMPQLLTMAILATAYLGGGCHESYVALHHVGRAWLGVRVRVRGEGEGEGAGLGAGLGVRG